MPANGPSITITGAEWKSFLGELHARVPSGGTVTINLGDNDWLIFFAQACAQAHARGDDPGAVLGPYRGAEFKFIE